MSILLITPCTNRKSTEIADRVKASDLSMGTCAQVGAMWRSRIRNAKHKYPARVVYLGRGAQEAKKAAEIGRARHCYLSAGLGLIDAEEHIPGYDLTVSGSSANQIAYKCTDEGFSSQFWWEEVKQLQNPNNSLTELVCRSKSIVILALPTPYLTMISGDLGNLSAAHIKKLRIIGPPKSSIADLLMPQWIPYDQRLNGPDSPIKGTGSDFAQRAARHFLEYVMPNKEIGSSVVKHIAATEAILSRYRYPEKIPREKKSDVELIELIDRHWDDVGGLSNRMLRYLRDQKKISCEQSRFTHLFNSVKSKRLANL